MDLIIVGDDRDRFANEFAEFSNQQGYNAIVLDVSAAARLFSIRIDRGIAEITPQISILFRIPAPSLQRTSFDDSFQYGECLATLWAAATLNPATVINRPTNYSLWGRTSPSFTLTKMRAGLTSPHPALAGTPLPNLGEGQGVRADQAEVFSLRAPSPPAALVSQQWYVQDAITYQTAAWPEIPEGEGPYRARCADPNLAYEIVIVLGDRAWRSTAVSLEHLELEPQSISLLKRLDLTFGAVTWGISPDLQTATLARVDPFPTMEQVQFVWPVLAPALLEAFFS
ncbi:MAG: hypothetical protein KME17_03280 [Cyanosarcina radialis HA8281-LM2]|jgi:hypothetical protein|nr:hypothetical protein [Cyanosarcina radialis HA8281-LM2]